jgi:hypothetical protein
MDFAHETKKNKTLEMAEQRQVPQKTKLHGYPYSSFWDLLQQCETIRPLFRKIEYP